MSLKHNEWFKVKYNIRFNGVSEIRVNGVNTYDLNFFGSLSTRKKIIFQATVQEHSSGHNEEKQILLSHFRHKKLLKLSNSLTSLWGVQMSHF